MGQLESKSQCRRDAGETALKWGCLCVSPPQSASAECRPRTCPATSRSRQGGPPQQNPPWPLRSPRGPLGPTQLCGLCTTHLRLPAAPRKRARCTFVFLVGHSLPHHEGRATA